MDVANAVVGKTDPVSAQPLDTGSTHQRDTCPDSSTLTSIKVTESDRARPGEPHKERERNTLSNRANRSEV